MLASVRSELAIMRTMTVSLGVMCVIVCIFMCFGMGSYAGASAACAMVPMLVMFSLLGYDDRNGWLRYRCALPFSRHDTTAGTARQPPRIYALQTQKAARQKNCRAAFCDIKETDNGSVRINKNMCNYSAPPEN